MLVPTISLTFPPPFFFVLVALWLSFNRVDSINATGFTGTLPAVLGQLSQLSDLELVDNSFTGPLPTTLGALTLLRYFFAQDNFFSGTIPTEFVSLTQLVDFNVTSNRLTGEFPSGMCSLTSLVNRAVDCAVHCTCCAVCSG
jgi:hypothetical protein